MSSSDRITFHSNHGQNINLLPDCRTAERGMPTNIYHSGTVFTNRPLMPDELFQVRLDKVINKWSGNVEIGITSENPSNITTTHVARELIKNSSLTILWDGTNIESQDNRENSYGDLPSSKFKEGMIFGIRITKSGDMHYYVDGKDLGKAVSNIPPNVYGIVDIYGDACKMTIVDSEQSLLYPAVTSSTALKFHSRCSQNAEVFNNNQTARRIGIKQCMVMTNRTLQSNELFEVVIEKIDVKWAGALEIGVTELLPTNIDYFPDTLSEIVQNTWCVSGPNLMADGYVCTEDYCTNLDRLQVNDTLGVRVINGDLHVYINGKDQNVAARNMPKDLYGIVDLIGCTVQVSIVEHPSSSSVTAPANQVQVSIVEHPSSSSVTAPANQESRTPAHRGNNEFDIVFHDCCGDNISLFNNKLSAKRDTSMFSNGVVLTSRIIEPDELFEIELTGITHRWSGVLEMGVTSKDPNDTSFQLPSTMSQAQDKTWMLVSGNIVHKQQSVNDQYAPKTADLVIGDKLGVMVKSNHELHFFLNGNDLGCAAKGIPHDVYGVVDLYGSAEEINIVNSRQVSAATRQPLMPVSSITETEYPIKTLEGLIITIKSGNIVNEKVDVLVNTTSQNFQLRVGAISCAILNAAGDGIQREIGNKTAKVSEILETSAGKIPGVKAIYHGAVDKFDGGRGTASLSKFIKNCLERANKNNMRSLGMPAVGTGVLGFPPETTADVIVKTFKEFSQMYGSSAKLQDVRVVLYHADNKTIEGFRRYFSSNNDIQDTDKPSDFSRSFQITVPDCWEPMKQNELCRLIKLDENNSEYTKVYKQFIDSGGPKHVIKIERIQSPNMYMMYMTRKRYVEGSYNKSKFKVPEHTLFHGTHPDAIDSINKNGFNRSYCGRNAVRWGQGVYFAKEASYSATKSYSPADSNGIRHIYLCQVLTGDYTLGDTNYKTPPPKPGKQKNELYDTVVDDENIPKIFVTFHDAQAYPEYLISFT